MSDSNGVAASARLRLITVASLGLAGLAVSGVYQQFGVGFPCPWRWITGTLCPICGSTRMGAALLSFDLPGAWHENPFVLSLGVLVALASIAWIIEAFGGPALRLPAWLRKRRLWLWVIAAVAAGFTVARNL